MDGNAPKIGENAYSEDFEVLEATTVQAIAVDSKSGKTSEVARVDFDLAKGNWKPITSDSNANWAIDEKSQTYWTSTENELELDLRDEVNLSGFTYLPMQARYPSGYISEYSLEVSLDGKTWKGISKGEFSNIQNSPIEQMVRFDQAAARFIRFKALKTTDRNPATFGEFGVLTR
ncbi:discoidin domain-containing protein [Algoriphagus boritolerans]|uniref:discoidin domain-containing protein n=1 Tax=Algoriphagus boritolerans TaxID=308111 RepID=UPI000A71244F